ncbi:hypothetical protein [Janthinobacterium sp. GW458P]|uniref:hypothetical protein n=1 Tax=Janthinobacterium sp. GW458P TaxID=1981504 RepID=UPI00111CD295|nr:hypothetical protein [Janthinobacterium sp. GW458P]
MKKLALAHAGVLANGRPGTGMAAAMGKVKKCCLTGPTAFGFMFLGIIFFVKYLIFELHQC